MGYCILKCYKEKCKKIEHVQKTFNKKYKCCFVLCWIVLVSACVIMLKILLYYPQKIWFLIISAFFVLIVMFLLIHIDNQNLEKYMDVSKNKFDILEEVLSKNLTEVNRKKIEELIDIYQMLINDRKEKEKRRNYIILTLVNIPTTIGLVLFERQEIMEINFLSWCNIVILVSTIVMAGYGIILLYTHVDLIKNGYKMMIKDLTELLLMRY